MKFTSCLAIITNRDTRKRITKLKKNDFKDKKPITNTEGKYRSPDGHE